VFGYKHAAVQFVTPITSGVFVVGTIAHGRIPVRRICNDQKRLPIGGTGCESDTNVQSSFARFVLEKSAPQTAGADASNIRLAQKFDAAGAKVVRSAYHFDLFFFNQWCDHGSGALQFFNIRCNVLPNCSFYRTSLF
jgi:hypothetical protein